ncbi:hypothetical protein GCM10011365_10290 [Marinicella pacifica]|uniref:DUF4398 domain-containing protein n=1 Tax=Marinicella pacifica TaxID=1171543 RepID=A0A917FLJ5_9GAMM|nr:DUF4398 domain-containing protein [Marinicella pacifica]GGF91033.1 hypothetical protein GCM10011365_10290 [Marinicella pacifica]
MMTKPLQSLKKALLLAFLSTLIACSPPTVVEINDNTYYQLEEQVEAVKNSQVADAAPLEMKFITEKLQRAKKAKAMGEKREEARLTQQIRSDIEVARLRAKVNRMNQALLEKRDELSAARVYLQQLEAQLP